MLSHAAATCRCHMLLPFAAEDMAGLSGHHMGVSHSSLIVKGDRAPMLNIWNPHMDKFGAPVAERP